jgi:hypothetical protein
MPIVGRHFGQHLLDTPTEDPAELGLGHGPGCRVGTHVLPVEASPSGEQVAQVRRDPAP